MCLPKTFDLALHVEVLKTSKNMMLGIGPQPDVRQSITKA